MNTGDANYIKRLNRRLLIEEIVKNISLSRSDLSRITGLNKATISTQVHSLMEEGIVIEKSTGESFTRGRKPIMIEINDRAGFSIGIDIDESKTNIVFCDLKGSLVHHRQLSLNTFNFDEMIEALITELHPDIEHFQETFSQIGLIGIGVGIHGIVNNESQIVYTPKQQWVDLDIKDHLAAAFNVPVYVDNNANLSVFAEQVYYEQVPDLFCITLYSGIGLGIIKDFSIYRGSQGFAGEIGHMIVEPHGESCACGNYGCWELYASNKAFFQLLQKQHPGLTTYEEMQEIVAQGLSDSILNQYIFYLAVGLNNIINIFNPERIVINGPLFAYKPELVENIKKHLRSKFNNYKELKVSLLHEEACALGGAALAFKNFFDIQIIDHSQASYISVQG